jgi:hypothetical protein
MLQLQGVYQGLASTVNPSMITAPKHFAETVPSDHSKLQADMRGLTRYRPHVYRESITKPVTIIAVKRFMPIIDTVVEDSWP